MEKKKQKTQTNKQKQTDDFAQTEAGIHFLKSSTGFQDWFNKVSDIISGSKKLNTQIFPVCKFKFQLSGCAISKKFINGNIVPLVLHVAIAHNILEDFCCYISV